MGSIFRSVGFRLTAPALFIIAAALFTFWTLEKSSRPPSPEAERYLMHAIAQVRAHHINSANMDWPKVTAEARSRIRGASDPADTYAALRWLIRQTGEPHSSFRTPSEVKSLGGRSFFIGPAPERPSSKRIGNIGLVRLPGLASPPAEMRKAAAEYTGAVHALLVQLDEVALCGWIIDLRGNGGGNMWPMLGGLGPLLGEPPFGYFVTTDGDVTPWSLLDGTPQLSLRQSELPVAVLIDARTASSGEMTALSLIGRPNVRTFGEASAGLTTANMALPMPDDALLVITASFVRDRTGRDYRGTIEPDVHVATSEAEDRAALWLKERCRVSS